MVTYLLKGPDTYYVLFDHIILSVQKLSTPGRRRICTLAYERVKGGVDSHAQILLNANIVDCFFFALEKLL